MFFSRWVAVAAIFQTLEGEFSREQCGSVRVYPPVLRRTLINIATMGAPTAKTRTRHPYLPPLVLHGGV
jgi:hypothetical protein